MHKCILRVLCTSNETISFIKRILCNKYQLRQFKIFKLFHSLLLLLLFRSLFLFLSFARIQFSFVLFQFTVFPSSSFLLFMPFTFFFFSLILYSIVQHQHQHHFMSLNFIPKQNIKTLQYINSHRRNARKK